MRCEDVRAALIDARYDGADLDASTRDHLSSCEACRARQASSDALDAVLAAADDGPPGPGFDTRFFARLKQEREQRAGGWPAWLRWSFVAAAAPALALAILFGLRTTDAPVPTTMTPADAELIAELDLLEAMPVVEKLEEIEAYEVLAAVDLDELDRLLAGEGTP